MSRAIEVDRQPKKLWLSSKEGWYYAVGHTMSVGRYNFSVVVTEEKIRISELTTGSLFLLINMDFAVLASTSTEEDTIHFYKNVIGNKINKVIDGVGEVRVDDTIREFKKYVDENLGEMPPIEDFDVEKFLSDEVEVK